MTRGLLSVSDLGSRYYDASPLRNLGGLKYCRRPTRTSYLHWAGRFYKTFSGRSGAIEQIVSYRDARTAGVAWREIRRSAEGCDSYQLQESDGSTSTIRVGGVAPSRIGDETFTVRWSKTLGSGRTYRWIDAYTKQGSVLVKTGLVTARNTSPYRPALLKIARKADLKATRVLF